MGNKLQNFIHSEWSNWGDQVAKILPAWNSLQDLQINEFLEVYWAFAPWDGNPASYGMAYRNASLLFEARKNLRPYPITPQPDLKCSLCGVRSAIGGDQAEQYWENFKVKNKFGISTLRTGERLCAVCSLKRLGQYAPSIPPLAGISAFPSTSKVAVSSFIAAIHKHWTDCKDAALAFVTELVQLGFIQLRGKFPNQDDFVNLDGDYFFPDFYRSKLRMVEERGAILSETQEKNIITLLSKLCRAVEACKPPAIQPGLTYRPNPYYAILLMDGDRMGLLIDQVEGLEEHLIISQALEKVAATIRKEAIKYHASLVYAGGDDLLAFLPVDCALVAANEFQQIFTSELATQGFTGKSASAGIVVIHHQFPLNKALTEVREMERVAKDSLNRNALGIRVIKHSGEPRQAGLHWGGNTLQTLEEVRQKIASSQLSGNFAYEFFEEAEALPMSIREDELVRLISRHSPPPMRSAAKTLAHSLEAITNPSQLAPRNPSYNLSMELAEWLILIRFLAKGG